MSKFGGWRGIANALGLAWVAGLSAKFILDALFDPSHATRVAVGVTVTSLGLIAGLVGAFMERRRRERGQVAFEHGPERPQIS